MTSIWTQNEIEILQKHYYDIGGRGCEELLGFSKTKRQITSKATKIGLKVSSSYRKYNQSLNAKCQYEGQKSKSNISEDKFLKISPESAYILGFIFADGYLMNTKSNLFQISLEILEKDYNSIFYIFDFVGKWTKSKRTRKQRQPQMKIQTCNRILYAFLVDHGYKQRSLGADLILEYIPPKYHKDFIRGYFDGDGCFYFHKKQSLRQCSVCSCYEQDWSFLEKILVNMEIKYKIVKRIQGDNKYSVLRFVGRDNIKKFGDYIYNDSCGHLLRKYQKFLDIME